MEFMGDEIIAGFGEGVEDSGLVGFVVDFGS